MTQTLIHGDSLDWLRNQKDKVYDCGFADIPDNLGLAYDEYNDNKSLEEYYLWLELLIHLALPKFKVFWLTYFHRHDIELKYRLRNLLKNYFGAREVRTYIWTYHFGQHREEDNPNYYRPILRIASPMFKPIMREKIPTVREEMGDLRATGLGKPPSDVWDFCRIQGNNNERRSWHPTQIPEAIYRRIILQSVSEGGIIVDLFAGTGTLFRVKVPEVKFDRIGVELSSIYCEQIRKEHSL